MVPSVHTFGSPMPTGSETEASESAPVTPDLNRDLRRVPALDPESVLNAAYQLAVTNASDGGGIPGDCAVVPPSGHALITKGSSSIS